MSTQLEEMVRNAKPENLARLLKVAFLPEGFETQWPTKDGQYKAVQLVITQDGNEYRPIVFSEEIGDRHAEVVHGNILRDYLLGYGIHFNEAEIKPGKRFPAKKGGDEMGRYEVVGAGNCIVSGKGYIFTSVGHSADYELEINPEHLEWHKRENPDKEIVP